ncbi:excinuclease ABC subunit UvrA [Streptomyces sp. SID7958]|uniref:UvrABC system protein A n=2 Tax=unclassified Streptomyces TaxID=2593676 RepID=A0A6G3R0E1_9ACTN|nr:MULTISPECIES: excinuclease ABC subunit UvrA [unclassified Streptomyces]NEA89223.1 excinuclease ABC subunit UvrA [Streptomyces sp. SID14436]NEC82562.1 excinuclease ABC subunit UvrA [Streptomyces sp. SID7958]
MSDDPPDGFVRVRGAGEHNLRNVDVDIPRDAMVAFTGVSGSGKSSLAFGTLYAEAQRRYFESVAPYARRLLHQVGAPHVQEITGLPPAVALQQRRGAASSRSTVGTLTTLSNLLRMLYSRAGTYPRGAARLEAEAFSPNTVAGACPRCHGLGVVHDVAEELLVPDPSLSIRDGAIAAWPGAWQGANLRSVVRALGIDVDAPWRELSKEDRDWLLYTDEQPSVLIPPEPGRIDHSYHGKFWSARKHIMHVLADSKSQRMRDRAMRFVRSVTCPECGGSRIRPEALAVTFAGRSIAEVNAMPLAEVVKLLRPVADLPEAAAATPTAGSGESTEVAVRICGDLVARIDVLLRLGLGYLGLGRRSTTLSPGEAQRLRIATQLRSGLFGVVYVLDEPSAGLHPADAEPLLDVLDQLRASGNSLFVVEHDLDVVRRADWVVDIGPGAGGGGGRVLYSGPVAGLEDVEESATGRHLFGRARPFGHRTRSPQGWLHLTGVTRHNLRDLSVDVPLRVLTAVTGVSGSGKSTLVTQVLAEVVGRHLGQAPEEQDDAAAPVGLLEAAGLESFDRLVLVDQRPIGRTPRSNLATYTGMFDAVRRLYASTAEARARGYTAGRFSFNVAEGRCETCQGEGFVAVELLFLPGTYAPCPTCHGARYNAETLEVTHRGRNIAEVLAMSVDEAATFLADAPAASRSLETLRDVGLGYLRLGQPATELSGGEAQRIKLATELQRARRGHTLYLLDEPTEGLHPADVQLLLRHLHRLVDIGNTVVLVEHDLATVASTDWVIDLGPGGGDAGGRVVATGTPAEVAANPASATAPYLARQLERS